MRPVTAARPAAVSPRARITRQPQTALAPAGPAASRSSHPHRDTASSRNTPTREITVTLSRNLSRRTARCRRSRRSWASTRDTAAVGQSRGCGRRVRSIESRGGGRSGEERGDYAAVPTGPRAGDGARHPAQGREVFRDGDELVSRFQFVQDHRDAFGVKRLCRVLECSRSGFYRWLAGVDARAARRRADAELAERIKKIHADSDGTYGSPRVTAALRGAGLKVNRKRVTRVMRSFSIVGVHLRKTVRTTIPEPSAAPVPDLLQRDFTATAPNTRYVGDITYLPIGDGQFLYLAVEVDALRGHRRRDEKRNDQPGARGTAGSSAEPVRLVPLTCPELVRLLPAFVLTPPSRDAEQTLRWMAWRRHHQAVTQACHQRRHVPGADWNYSLRRLPHPCMGACHAGTCPDESAVPRSPLTTMSPRTTSRGQGRRDTRPPCARPARWR